MAIPVSEEKHGEAAKAAVQACIDAGLPADRLAAKISCLFRFRSSLSLISRLPIGSSGTAGTVSPWLLEAHVDAALPATSAEARDVPELVCRDADPSVALQMSAGQLEAIHAFDLDPA